MPKDATAKASGNEQAVTQALDDFVKRVHNTLAGRPDMHGSIALTMHCAYGQIKKFDLTVDETRLCQH